MAAEPLAAGTYEVLRNRLREAAGLLRTRLEKLNEARNQVFGNVGTRLLATAHVTTDHNCFPRDLAAVGKQLILGYNVQFGLKSDISPADVFSIYGLHQDGASSVGLKLISDPQFQRDFVELYRYYKHTSFTKFFHASPFLYMVFQVGKTAADVKAFKWQVQGESLKYVDNRSEHEVRFPPQHEFEWRRTTRDQHRSGQHPHISIQDKVFVECVGGDLTIKVEDNTALGSGIYSEPVEQADQTLDDAEIYYALLGSLVLLKIRPYKERAFRHLVFNVKRQQVRRIDPIEQSCVLLPDEHGIIFSGGYQLQTGGFKLFDHGLRDMLYERTVASPNGEDYLYLFYNRESGAYIQLRYNLIRQEVDTPLVTSGQAFFEDGQMVCFRANEEPQRHHALQVWQTPFVATTHTAAVATDSYLYKIGNAELVRGSAECQELLQLIQRDEEYADLYVDLEKRSGDILDSYFWLTADEAMKLAEPLTQVRSAAAAAVEEFATVTRLRRETESATAQAEQATNDLVKDIQRSRFESLDDFVIRLGKLREQRGRAIGLKDLRYVDANRVAALEKTIMEAAERLGRRCVEALLDPKSLAPYRQRIELAGQEVAKVTTAAAGRKLDEQIKQIADALELLIDTVGTLKIDDATQRTAIVDRTGELLGELNRVRSTLRSHVRALVAGELQSEYASQTRLLDQAVAGALETADQPEKVDQSLTRMMVQLQELESHFADSDELIARLVEKRESVFAAFEAKRQQLVEARTKRAETLANAAERVLAGIASRALKINQTEALHAFLAADPMVEKVREIAEQLRQLGDSVRMNDLMGRLKTIGEDSIRQLRDRQELFTDGENIIRLGQHPFAVNRQPIELTTVLRDGSLQLHLTGTQFYEPLVDPALDAARDLWDQSLVSENGEIYRGEYLAEDLLRELLRHDGESHPAEGSWGVRTYTQATPEQRVEWVREQMGPRHREGYSRGVHDHDAAVILEALVSLHQRLGLLRYRPSIRASAWFVWQHLVPESDRQEIEEWVRGFRVVRKALPGSEPAGSFLRRLRSVMARHAAGVLSRDGLPLAADYLFQQLLAGTTGPAASPRAVQLLRAFDEHLAADQRQAVAEALAGLSPRPAAAWALALNAIDGFLKVHRDSHEQLDPALWYREELARLLLAGTANVPVVEDLAVAVDVRGLHGDHSRIVQHQSRLHYYEFTTRLAKHREQVAPRFEALQLAKQKLLDEARLRLRADEFKARVLTSFVRNRLIDEVYLPLIGGNLAKQIGAAGESKRTDRMGLLLLISPPGYGKTTLMEYIANRLGLVLVKVNGPALGHSVRSLDPQEATNAAARQELQRINLALEMGDNVMLYLDDIQHCNPELLQKFIPLCDATRRIEGVWQGRPKTYDLRSRQVAIVMAGNPYTESGDRFQIPDMLANRADVYNLGEIIGDAREAFELSYLENCLTGNPVLQPLSRASTKDQRALLRAAELGTTDQVRLESPLAADQVREMVQVLMKLLRVRDVVLKVNRAYIRSAAQADAYRTEPPFKLQGSYRNMNRIAERVVPVMNEKELETLIIGSYEQEAQTLTRDSEANLLKFKELLGILTSQETERWESIKYAYVESVKMAGMEGADRGAQVLQAISGLRDGLESIRRTMAQAVAADKREQQVVSLQEGLARLQSAVSGAGGELTRVLSAASADLGAIVKQPPGMPDQKVIVQHSVPRVMTDLVESQFQLLFDGLRPVLEQTAQSNQTMARVQAALEKCSEAYQALRERIS